MLNPALVFSVGGMLAMIGWLGLLIALFAKGLRPSLWLMAQIAIPALLAAAYIRLLWQGRAAFAAGGFGSIEEVRTLFANDSALAAGWLHYLAFDLFIGTWIVRDGVGRGIPAILVLPCLPLTFLFGPAGLLFYLALRLTVQAARKESRQ